jgi:dipeptidyl-peptidase-4
MRFILCFLALLAGTQASAEQLTLDRIHGDSSLSGPGVRSLKVSPDGARVTFLRGRDDNQFQLDLWEYNLKDKSTHRLVDSKILVPEETCPTPRRRAASASARRVQGHPQLQLVAGRQAAAGADRRQPVPDRCRQPDQARLVASGNVLDPKISPQGRYVSFVRDQNLFVIELSTARKSS